MSLLVLLTLSNEERKEFWDEIEEFENSLESVATDSLEAFNNEVYSY